MLCTDTFKSFEPLWQIGDALFQENNKIGFNIKFYCLNQLIKNKDKYTEKQTNTLIGMVQDVQEIQQKMNPSDIHCKQKEYESFIMNYFANLESQRTNGVITIELGQKYKQFSYMLEPLEQFNSLNDKARKIRKPYDMMFIPIHLETFCLTTSKELLELCSLETISCNEKGNSNNNNTGNNGVCIQATTTNINANSNNNAQNVTTNVKQINVVLPQETDDTGNIMNNDTNCNTHHNINNHTSEENFNSLKNDNDNETGKEKEKEDLHPLKCPSKTQIALKKRKYVNTPSTPKGIDSLVIPLSSGHHQQQEISDSFPERIEQDKHQHSSKELCLNQNELNKISPSFGYKQAEFVKKNNSNAINEFKAGNVSITIQLIKNSINTLNTLPKQKKNNNI